MNRNITLITMGQGNMAALKKTFESFKHICNEFVYGDLLIFPEDRAFLYKYKKQYNLKIFELPFNYIFQMGFADVLNYLAANATNDMVMYMNTSEIIDEDYGINNIIDLNEKCNSFYFTHRTDKHRWHRAYDRAELAWSGLIHEETVAIKGDVRPFYKPIFMMKDTEKDMDNPFKAAVFNSVKEMCYWQQLIRVCDSPKLRGATNEGWINYAKTQYDSMKERLQQKGNQYEAFKTGDFDMFLDAIYNSGYFDTAEFVSSGGLNFQGARKDIL